MTDRDTEKIEEGIWEREKPVASDASKPAPPPPPPPPKEDSDD